MTDLFIQAEVTATAVVFESEEEFRLAQLNKETTESWQTDSQPPSPTQS